MARLNPCPSLDSLFQKLLGSMKASCTVQIGQLKNLIWTSLKFSRPCGTEFGMGFARNLQEPEDLKVVERETGIEPATNGLGSRYSTIELLPPPDYSNPKPV
jgi:hypothetical protein